MRPAWLCPIAMGLLGACALAVPTGAAGQQLSSEQVLSIALSAATRSGDPRPTSITMASGPLKTADGVESPHERFGPGFPPNANTIVDLVAMHGCFASDGPKPPPGPGVEQLAPSCSTVMELIINESGEIAGQAWTTSVPVRLSTLGPVTQLDYAGEPGAAEGATGQELSPAQVLKLALTAAARSGDPRPTDITMASGPLKTVLEVEDPHSSFGPGYPPEADSLVDLVAMHGCFTYNGPQPPRRRGAELPPCSTVMELVIDGSGAIAIESGTTRVPVPLSHLGPVTQLRYPGEPRPTRKHHGRASPHGCRD